MKTLIIALGIVAVMGVIMEVSFNGETLIQKQTVVEEVVPDWADDEDAVKAAQDVIRRKELEAEKKLLESIVASTTGRIEAIDKELGFY